MLGKWVSSSVAITKKGDACLFKYVASPRTAGSYFPCFWGLDS